MVTGTVGAIIQVRLGSERLPQKALLPLPFGGGPSVLEHVVSRASASKYLQHIIVATTHAPADDQIESFCKEKGISCFRGDEQDVLARFYSAATHYNLNKIVRLTGDNPCIMPDVIDRAIEEHFSYAAAYTRTEGLPLGTNIEIMSFEALEQAFHQAVSPYEREHVTPYLYNPGSNLTTHFINLAGSVAPGLVNLRLTIDYPSDFALISLLFDKIYSPALPFTYQSIRTAVDRWPWLSHVNSTNNQKKVYFSEEEELADAVRLLQQAGMVNAAACIINKR